jgi:hypothetical protein
LNWNQLLVLTSIARHSCVCVGEAPKTVSPQQEINSPGYQETLPFLHSTKCQRHHFQARVSPHFLPREGRLCLSQSPASPQEPTASSSHPGLTQCWHHQSLSVTDWEIDRCFPWEEARLLLLCCGCSKFNHRADSLTHRHSLALLGETQSDVKVISILCHGFDLGWMNEWMNERTITLMNEQINKWMYRWMNDWENQQLNEWIVVSRKELISLRSCRTLCQSGLAHLQLLKHLCQFGSAKIIWGAEKTHCCVAEPPQKWFIQAFIELELRVW